MKIKNTKLWNSVVWNERLKWKIIEFFMPSKKIIIFFFYMRKMSHISKEEYKKCEVEIIDEGVYFWVNRKDLEVESVVANWAQIFVKCNPKNKNTDMN